MLGLPRLRILTNLKSYDQRISYRPNNKPISNIVPILAHTIYGPGYNATGSTLLSGDDSTKTYSGTFTNVSGTAISNASIVFQGWTLNSTGTLDSGNSFVVSGTVQYPSGTVVGTISATTVTSGSSVASATFSLSTPIPAGASFVVSLSSTIPTGSNYIYNLGFAGLRNHAQKGSLKKACLYGVGDSIMTGNGGGVINAATGKCPAYQASIVGTKAQAYGDNGAANFTKQVALARLLGVTHFVSNYGTNDIPNGTNITLSMLQGYLTNMRNLANLNGIQFVQCTMLPRTGANGIGARTASSVTSSGTSMVLTVPDASIFTVGYPYNVAGATQTEYNGTFECISRDTTANTVTLRFPGSSTTPATGTITINQWKVTYERAWMNDFDTNYAPGSSSTRGQFNSWIRAGAMDGYIEWADAVESARDSNRWKTAGETAYLPAPQGVTVASVISTTRFTSDYSRGSNTTPNGIVIARTGANAGYTRSANGNTTGDITLTAAWPNTQVVGDTYLVVPGGSYMGDDGTHLRGTVGGVGGQTHLDVATGAWIDIQLGTAFQPVNTALPSITGSTLVGQTLSATTGTWSNSPTSFAYQWYRSGVAISGATAATYLLISSDSGSTITVSVTATNSYGSVSAMSAATATITTPVVAPVNTAAPTISGSTISGQNLTATTGTWNNSPTSYTYQWYRSGVAISGATSSVYALVEADVGSTVTVAVTASNSGGSATATSAATATITSGAAAGTTFFNDTFTDTDGVSLITVNLVRHLADTGQGWSLQTGTSYSSAPTIASNRLYNPQSATNNWRAEVTAPSANYYVEAVIDCLSVVASDTCGICARASSSANTLYFVRYSQSAAGWQLYRTVNGTSTQIGSTVTATFLATQSKTVRLTVNGTTLTVSVDGTTIITQTDANITDAGSPGLRMGGAAQSSSTGLQLTSLKAVTI